MKIADFIIDENTSIVDIMKRLDYTARGIVYVCDTNGVLLGSITDGDVRRSIIRTGQLDTIAKVIMKTDPITLSENESNMADAIMRDKVITSIPIIDNNKKIIDICFLIDKTVLREKKKLNIPVVIMAGGKGVRLQPYTNILPKPLIPIGEKSITEHIIDRFSAAGCRKFEMIVNYKKHIIKAYFRDNDINAEIDFIDEEEFLGTAGGLRLLIGRHNSTFFVTNCDILIEDDYPDIYEYHKKSSNIATIVCAVKNTTLPYGVIKTNEDGRIEKIIEKPDISSIVNTGFYVLEPEFLEKIPEGKVSQITDVFQSCIDEGLRIGMYPVSEESWMDMGQLDELKKMTERLEGIV